MRGLENSLGIWSRDREKFLVLGLPLAFLLLFLIAPLVNIFVYSFWSLDPATGMMKSDWTLRNYLKFFAHHMYLQSLQRTLEVTLLVTGISLLFAYPVAYFVAIFVDKRMQGLLLFLIILPSWTSLLIRSFSWMSVLRSEGFLDKLLLSVGFISQPMSLLYSKTAVVIGLIHIYLPFMILPIYSNLRNLDLSLLDAARDLGATAFRAFLRVTLPLSFPGIATGVFLVALPVFGAFVTPKILGGTGDVMIGNVIEIQFKGVFNWPFGAAIASMVALLLLASMFAFNRFVGMERLSGSSGKG